MPQPTHAGLLILVFPDYLPYRFSLLIGCIGILLYVSFIGASDRKDVVLRYFGLKMGMHDDHYGVIKETKRENINVFATQLEIDYCNLVEY